MAQLESYKYETDPYNSSGKYSTTGSPTKFVFLVKSRAGIAVSGIAGAETSDTVDIAAHLPLFQNFGTFGIHPRYVELYRGITQSGGSPCLIHAGKIVRKLVILTRTRFDALVEKDDTTNELGTEITIGGIAYRVLRKLPERRDGEPNPK